MLREAPARTHRHSTQVARTRRDGGAELSGGGAQFVSLSGAPLARLDRGEQPCALQRLLDMIASTMEPAYGVRSLLHFKAKFQPAYQPLYLAYPGPAALGSITAAIGRAYLPHLTSRQALRLLGKLGWPQHRGCGNPAGDRQDRGSQRLT